jgi:hypothetical protein
MTSSGSLDNSKHPVGVVFLSHASKDLAFVSEIDRLLKDAGIPSWMAAVEIEPGANYADSIFKTLSLARACVVFLTEDSIASEHVRREVNIAIDQKIKLYPVSLKGSSEIISTLPADWKYWLSITQILTCTDANDAAQALLELFPEVLGTEYSPTDLDDDMSEKVDLWKNFFKLTSEAESLLEDSRRAADFNFDEFNRVYVAEYKEAFEWIISKIDSSDPDVLKIGRLLGETLYYTFTVFRPFPNANLEKCFEYYLATAAKLNYGPAVLDYLELELSWSYEDFNRLALRVKHLTDNGIRESAQHYATESLEMKSVLTKDPEAKILKLDSLFLIHYLKGNFLSLLSQIFSPKILDIDYRKIFHLIGGIKIELDARNIGELLKNESNEELALWFNLFSLVDAFALKKAGKDTESHRIISVMNDNSKQMILAHLTSRIDASMGFSQLIYEELLHFVLSQNS